MDIQNKVVNDLKSNKIPDIYKQAILILMLNSEIWHKINDGLLLLPNSVSVEFDIKFDISFGSLFEYLKEQIKRYLQYLLYITTGDTIGINEKEDRSFKNIMGNEYEFYYYIEITKTDRSRERLEFIKNLYKKVCGLNIDTKDLTTSFIDRVESIVEKAKNDERLYIYLKRLVEMGYITEALYPIEKWQKIKAEISHIKKEYENYGVCAICGKKFKRYRKEQFVCGASEDERCRKRFVYFLNHAKQITFKNKEDLKKQLQYLYNRDTGIKRHTKNIYDWDTIVDNIIIKLYRKNKKE